MRRLANVVIELMVLTITLFVFHFVVDPYVLFAHVVPLPQVTANPAEFVDRLLYFLVAPAIVFFFASVALGPLVWSDARRMAKEVYVLGIAIALAAVAMFFTGTVPFNPHMVLGVALLGVVLMLAISLASTLRRTNFSTALSNTGAVLLNDVKFLATPGGIVAVLLIISPVIMAVAYVKNRDFANAVTRTRMFLSEPQGKTQYTLVNAFPGVLFRRPMQVEFAPSDAQTAFVLERDGRFYRLTGGKTKELMLDLSGDVGSVDIENGALGFALHPDFGKSGSDKAGCVFIYYTHVADGAQQNRLVRYDLTASDPTARQAGGVTLYALDRAPSGFHNGGTVLFGPDGFLYVSLGEASDAAGHQTLSHSLFGGIIRIDVDKRGGDVSHPPPRQPVRGMTAEYFIPNDNPFVGRPDSMEEFYAIGLRNPYRFSIDRDTGLIWAGEVGSDEWEEVNAIEKGHNYQFPYVEGMTPTNYRKPDPLIGVESAPVYFYRHTANDRAVIGGFVYRANKLADLNGQYIFADNYSGKVWKMPPTRGQKLEPVELARAVQVAQRGISSLSVGPDGRILVTTLGSAGEENGRVWSLVLRGSAEDTGEEAPTQSSGAIAMSDTIETFNSACGRCHGVTGQGDGPDSGEIGGRFPNFSSPAYHRQRDDDMLFRIIHDGGAENGLREEMPPWRDILTEEEIRQIVKHLRNLQKPGDAPAYVTVPQKAAAPPAPANN